VGEKGKDNTFERTEKTNLDTLLGQKYIIMVVFRQKLYNPSETASYANATQVLTFCLLAFSVDEYLGMPGSRMAEFKKPSLPTSPIWMTVFLFPTDGKKNAHVVANVITGKIIKQLRPYQYYYRYANSNADNAYQWRN